MMGLGNPVTNMIISSSEEEPTPYATEFYSNPPMEDVLENLRIELVRMAKYRPLGNYIETIQRDGMTTDWRRKICKWMVEAAEDFDMTVDTIASAINYFDRYLSVYSADKMTVQLLSMVCLFIASKQFATDEMTMVEVEKIGAGKFSQPDIANFEKAVLHRINWNLCPPTCVSIARNLVTLMKNSKERELVMQDTMHILQICLSEYLFLKFCPAVIALAAVSKATSMRSFEISPSVQAEVNNLEWPMSDFFECESLINLSLEKGEDIFCAIEEHGAQIPRHRSPSSIEDLQGNNAQAEHLAFRHLSESSSVPDSSRMRYGGNLMKHLRMAESAFAFNVEG